ncbi:MAG: glycosyltransferase family 2 protein [Flavobacteriales bacterium]|nr:glycosyltransferase family 2 protein [Flavobacteriales bacterium]
MKVSIVTICFNSAETIRTALKSVIAQSYPDIEYIIVDGKSKDNTLSIVNEYKESIAKIISEEDDGIYDAMNKGVKAATGDVIGILNSDDLYANEHVVSNMVKAISDADAVYADLVYVSRKDTNQVTRAWRAGVYKKGLFKKGWMPPHPTFFVKKSCYDNYGYYSTELNSSADYELMLRLIHKHEISVNYFPETIVKMRVGGQSTISIKNRLAANKEDRRAWEMNGLQPGIATIRKPLSKLSQFLRKQV